MKRRRQTSKRGSYILFNKIEEADRGNPSSVKSDRIHESGEVNKWVNKYLGVGEWVLDQSVAFAGSSKYFERTR